MTRQYIDCREFPSEMHCSVALSADSEEELMTAAVQHAVSVHGHQDTPELRAQLRQCLHTGTPPLDRPGFGVSPAAMSGASSGAAPGANA